MDESFSDNRSACKTCGELGWYALSRICDKCRAESSRKLLLEVADYYDREGLHAKAKRLREDVEKIMGSQ